MNAPSILPDHVTFPGHVTFKFFNPHSHSFLRYERTSPSLRSTLQHKLRMGRRGRPRKNSPTTSNGPSKCTRAAMTAKNDVRSSPNSTKSTGSNSDSPAVTAGHVATTPQRTTLGQVDTNQPTQASVPIGLFTPQTAQTQSSNIENVAQVLNSQLVVDTPVAINAQLWQTVNKLSSQVAELANVQRMMMSDKQTGTAGGQDVLGSRQPSQNGDSMASILTGPGLSRTIPGLRDGNVDNLRMSELRSFCPIEGVPDTTIKSALKGEFIYLEQFLLNLVVSPEGEGELCQYKAEDGNVIYKPRRAKRKIFNLQSWLEAWNNYERLMINYHRNFELYEQMAEYRSFICNCDRKYMWSAITAYDIRHRAQLSRKSIEFSTLNISLQAQLLDASAVCTNASRCLRSKSFDHTVSECPFSQTAPRTSAVAPQKKKPEICRNFNALKCVITDCPRRHVCRVCYGELPFDLCAKNGPCSNSQVSTRS